MRHRAITTLKLTALGVIAFAIGSCFLFSDYTAPAEVTGLSAFVGAGQVILSWSDPLDEDLASIEITWTPDGSSAQSVPAGTEVYTEADLANGTEYTFLVRTVDTSGNTSLGEEISVTTDDGDLPASSWTHPDSLLDFLSLPEMSAYTVRAAANDSGDAIVIWQQYDGSVDRLYKSEYRDGDWTHPAGVTDGISVEGYPLQDPDVAMDNNGNTVIVWRQSNGATTQIFKSEYRNGAWTHPAGVADAISPAGQNAVAPCVAMSDGGDAIITWYQSDGTRPQTFRSEYRSNSWTHPADLSDNIGSNSSSTTHRGPVVAMDASGNAVIAWIHRDSSSDFMVYKSEYRGASWTDPASSSDTISPSGADADSIAVLMDNLGNTVIVWEQGGVMMSEYRNNSWTHPSDLTDYIGPGNGGYYAPKAAIDQSSGDLIIAWQEPGPTNGGIFMSEYRDGTWAHPSAAADAISPATTGAFVPAVAMGSGGDAVIAWFQADGESTDRTFFSEYRNGSWTHPADIAEAISPAGQSAYYQQVAVAGDGSALIVWEQSDGVTDQIYMSEYR